MRIYRVSYYINQAGHQGFTFHSSKAEATKASRKFTEQNHEEGDRSEIEQFDLSLRKRDVLGALDCYGGHPDNG